jgi:hypothetical protein
MFSQILLAVINAIHWLQLWPILLNVNPIINVYFVTQVGCSHEDVDAIIGNLVSYLRPRDIRTYEELVQAMKDALYGMEGKVNSVIVFIGITDYDYMFEDVARNDVVGITKVMVLKFSADDADGNVCGYYIKS